VKIIAFLCIKSKGKKTDENKKSGKIDLLALLIPLLFFKFDNRTKYQFSF